MLLSDVTLVNLDCFLMEQDFVYRASKTLRQASLTFCQTVMDDDLPFPAKEDLESAYRIAGAKQFKGRLRDVFMVLSDDHQKKPNGDVMPSLSEPFVLPKESKDPTQTFQQPQKPASASKGNMRKGSSEYMTAEFKLSRSEK